MVFRRFLPSLIPLDFLFVAIKNNSCSQLSASHRDIESGLDVCGPDFSTEEVVLKYKTKEEERIRQMREEWQRKLEKKTNAKNKRATTATDRRKKRKRNNQPLKS